MRVLEESKFGIICLTAENVDKPWVLFESGALWKAFGQARVCPYLLNLEKSEVRPPLGHFQASRTDKEDTWKLVRSINDAVKEEKGKFRTEGPLSEAFEVWWPKLESKLIKIPADAGSKTRERKEGEVLAEILETARGVQREVSKIAAKVNQPFSLLPAPVLPGMVRAFPYNPSMTDPPTYIPFTTNPPAVGIKSAAVPDAVAAKDMEILERRLMRSIRRTMKKEGLK